MHTYTHPAAFYLPMIDGIHDNLTPVTGVHLFTQKKNILGLSHSHTQISSQICARVYAFFSFLMLFALLMLFSLFFPPQEGTGGLWLRGVVGRAAGRDRRAHQAPVPDRAAVQGARARRRPARARTHTVLVLVQGKAFFIHTCTLDRPRRR